MFFCGLGPLFAESQFAQAFCQNATHGHDQAQVLTCDQGTSATRTSLRTELKLGRLLQCPTSVLISIGEVFKNQGVMILEDTEIAIDKADSLAEEICVVRPQLCSKGYAVRVTDRDGSELYRTPVDQIPLWLRSSPRRP